jgi:cytochrome d ubiquinol oxidase subunit I
VFGLFGIVFALFLYFAYRGTLGSKRWLLAIGVSSFFLAMIGSQAGWVVAEVGRQPWAIQDMLPVNVAATKIGAGDVQTTFFLFLTVFTLLLLAEIRIMTRQIGIGPKEA